MPLLITFCVLFLPAAGSIFLPTQIWWMINHEKSRERERKFHHRHFLPGYWLNRDMQERGEGVRAVGTAATILAWNKDALYCIICREHSCRSFGWTTNGPWTAQQRWQYRLDLAQRILTWGEKKNNHFSTALDWLDPSLLCTAEDDQLYWVCHHLLLIISLLFQYGLQCPVYL